MGNGRAFKKHAQGKESEIGIEREREREVWRRDGVGEG